MTIIVIGTTVIVSLLILGLFMVFSSEEEPEWNREEILFKPISKKAPHPFGNEVKGISETDSAVVHPHSSTVNQPEVAQDSVDAVRSELVV